MATQNRTHPAHSRALPQRIHDFRKAYRKARDWRCPPLPAAVAAWRYALTGDSGRFVSHGGARLSRISRGGED